MGILVLASWDGATAAPSPLEYEGKMALLSSPREGQEGKVRHSGNGISDIGYRHNLFGLMSCYQFTSSNISSGNVLAAPEPVQLRNVPTLLCLPSKTFSVTDEAYIKGREKDSQGTWPNRFSDCWQICPSVTLLIGEQAALTSCVCERVWSQGLQYVDIHDET